MRTLLLTDDEVVKPHLDDIVSSYTAVLPDRLRGCRVWNILLIDKWVWDEPELTQVDAWLKLLPVALDKLFVIDDRLDQAVLTNASLRKLSEWEERGLANKCIYDAGGYLYRQLYGWHFAPEFVEKNGHGSFNGQRTSHGNVIRSFLEKRVPKTGDVYVTQTEKGGTRYEVRRAWHDHQCKKQIIVELRAPTHAEGTAHSAHQGDGGKYT